MWEGWRPASRRAFHAPACARLFAPPPPNTATTLTAPPQWGIRNAECGMSVRAYWSADPSLQFRIPHSAFVLIIPQSAIGHSPAPVLNLRSITLVARRFDARSYRRFSSAVSGTIGGTCVGTPCSSSATYVTRSEEHTSELQSRLHLVCRLLLEKKKRIKEALPRHHTQSP